MHNILVVGCKVLISQSRSEDNSSSILQSILSNRLLNEIHILCQELRLLTMNKQIYFVAHNNYRDAQIYF